MGGRYPAFLDAEVLGHPLADALDDAAVYLPLVHDGVDDGADVVGSDEPVQLYVSRLRVDLDLGDLGHKAADVVRRRALNLTRHCYRASTGPDHHVARR